MIQVVKSDIRCSVSRFVTRWVSQSFWHTVNNLIKYFDKFVSHNKQFIRIRSSRSVRISLFWNETPRGLSGFFLTGTEANESSLGAPYTDVVELDAKPPS